MMRGNLDRRLAALEASHAALASGERRFMGGIKLVMHLIAAHLGDMSDRDSVMEAYARALGYAGSPEVRSALRARTGTPAREEFDRRHTEAVAHLLDLQGANVRASGIVVRRALQLLVDGLPEAVCRRHAAEDTRANLREAVEWLCISS